MRIYARPSLTVVYSFSMWKMCWSAAGGALISREVEDMLSVVKDLQSRSDATGRRMWRACLLADSSIVRLSAVIRKAFMSNGARLKLS